jgi:uncharacterized Fe-S cluster-containing protein
MQTIMHTSSDTLSKKVRAFEKKYIETYLKDKSRIDDCHQTLEELFKRSKAISEIKQKVILYKEFYKLLQLLDNEDLVEDAKKSADELKCSKNYERLTDLHNQTINLWKMVLYWKKRSEMC